MTERTIGQQNKRVLIALLLAMAAIAAYRIVLMEGYLTRYIDDDQALMWYGTVLASHGGIREPHFLGQMYGSMLESIWAVPLYRAGVPLEWALPLVCFAGWFFPFVYCALLCRKKLPVVSFCILLSTLLYHWDYDILTNIPRSYISGFPFAFLGLGLMISDRKPKPWKLLLAVLLMGFAYLNTVTTIAVSAFGVLYLFLYRPERLKRGWWALPAGLAIVLPVLYYCNVRFYELNPDYWVFGDGETLSLSLRVFLRNLWHSIRVMRTFSLANLGMVPVCFIVYGLVAFAWFRLLWKKGDRRFLLVILCALVGSGLFMFVSRTRYYDNNITYTASRQYLYFPYVVITVLLLYAQKCRPEEISRGPWPVLKRWKLNERGLRIGFLLLVAALTGFKLHRFDDHAQYWEIYEGTPRIRIYAVADVYRLADELRVLAEENGTDILISVNHVFTEEGVEPSHENKCMDYATSALNYDKYTEYRSYFDRRTDVYHRLQQRVLQQEPVLFIRLEGPQIAETELVTLDQTDCISYLEAMTGLLRSEIIIRQS